MANAWAQQDKESWQAYAAFCAYRDLPPVQRSLEAAFQKIRIESGSKAHHVTGTWRTWSVTWRWVERVTAYDAEQQRIDDELRKEERAKIMAHRYANDYERVRALDEVSANLLEMTKDEAKVWLPDIKVVGFGKEQQTVDIVRFNAPLFDQLRGSLMDIARHKGELVQKTDVTSNGETVKGYIGVDTDKV